MSELREALEEAYDAAEETEHAEQPREETGRQEQVAEEPVRATAEEPAEKAVARDEAGRFARKPEEPKEEQPKVEQPEEQPKAEQSFKAPASWKPTAREHWSQIPVDVQQEIVRREHEAQQVLQQTAEARQVSHALQNLSQKYNAALSAEGVDILTATDNLAQIATKLRFGQTGEKAELIARLIQVYGVDITTLDNVLAGLPPQPAAMQQQTFHDPRLDQLLAKQQEREQQKRAQAQQEATAEVDSFASGREFFSDVREMMADIIEVAARRNLDLTLEQAYDQAIKLHPEVSKIVAQRAQASAAQSPTRPTARSKQAASSVKSSPVGGTGQQESGSLREDILSAMESANGR
jgi:hypothetical protein